MEIKHLSSRILSIQSHVVYGHVGNSSAVFPLQLLNYEVDSINSVQLSNHTQYDHCTGQILSSEDLDTIYQSLKSNNINKYSHILTGYVGNFNFLVKLVEIISDLKKGNPSTKYYCDPVLGDDNKIYVPKELIPIYQEKVLPLADVLMPNQFEAELLSCCKITDETSALDCIEILHNRYNIPLIVLSSTQLNTSDDRGALLTGFASYRPSLDPGISPVTSTGEPNSKNSDSVSQRIRITFPHLPGTFFGTGDLFSALTLAHLENAGINPDLKKVFYKVQCTMHAVLQRTIAFFAEMSSDPNCNSPFSALYELKLVQSAQDIISPPQFPSIKVVDI